MMHLRGCVALLVVCSCSSVTSFVLPQRQTTNNLVSFSGHVERPASFLRRSPTTLEHFVANKLKLSLFATSRRRSNDGGGGGGQYQLPNDFRMFLNQCTIQSFMFLLRNLRDIHTINWLEDFTQPAIVRKVSDEAADENNWTTGGFVTEEESQKKKKTSKLLQYHGLGAMNTDLFATWEEYFRVLLQQQEEILVIESVAAHIPDYELDIIPASLCSRMISVREQIAKEWVKDLDVIATMGDAVMESYWDALEQSRAEGRNDGEIRIERTNVVFLEFDPSLNAESATEEAVAPSPLRKGSFDLLVLLSTQEAVLRVLNDKARQDGAARVSNEFLANFYRQRERTHFSGSQRYNRADDFLQDLLSTPPSMINVREGVTSLIDPHRMVEMILEERKHVAREWQEIARTSPEEHYDVRRMMLNVRMGIAVQ